MTSDLGSRLEQLYEAYNREDAASDRIQSVRGYPSPADQEIIGYCAAALAFGRVASVLNTVERRGGGRGPGPAAYVGAFDPAAPHPELRAMVHRWTRGVDIVALLWLLRQMIDRSGSIERFFLEGYDPEATDIGEALDSFSRRALALDLKAVYARRRPATTAVGYFFPRPSAGSGCKRLNLFLRGMVRRGKARLGA